MSKQWALSCKPQATCNRLSLWTISYGLWAFYTIYDLAFSPVSLLFLSCIQSLFSCFFFHFCFFQLRLFFFFDPIFYIFLCTQYNVYFLYERAENFWFWGITFVNCVNRAVNNLRGTVDCCGWKMPKKNFKKTNFYPIFAPPNCWGNNSVTWNNRRGYE